MQNREIARQLQELNELFEKVDAACGTNMEMRSHWAKYICVVASGVMENAIAEIFYDFAREASNPPIASYVGAMLSRIKNPNAEIFYQTARSFDTEWGEKLKTFLADDGRREALNSIMTERHKVAHGQNSDITIARIQQYLRKAEEVLDYLEDLCANR